MASCSRFTHPTSFWLLIALLSLAGASPLSAQSIRPAPEIISLTRLGQSRAPVVQPGAIVARSTPVCGTSVPSATELEAVRSALERWQDEGLSTAPGGTIRVAFHVITAGGQGDVSDERLAEQIRALNRDFASSGYRFELASVDRNDQSGWYRMTPGSSKERKAKETLAIDPSRHLNIYLCGLGQGLLGWASLPWSQAEGHALQGVVLDNYALLGGEARLAQVATHQVAHYLGLLPAEGVYGAGAALASEQIERLRQMVPVYHPSLFSNAPARAAPATPEISPAAGAEPEEGRVLSYRGAFPNPFRGETALRFTLPSSGPVSLRIYSVTGQLVRTLVDATLPAGDHSAMFRAEGLPSGAYFAVLKAGSVQMCRTLMLIR